MTYPLPQQYDPQQKSMIIAVLLGIFVGYLGFHRFYLGKIGTGIVQLLLTGLGSLLAVILVGYVFLAIVAVWVFIDVVMILAKENYTDSSGRTLKRGL